jgi:hypothetical protein
LYIDSEIVREAEAEILSLFWRNRFKRFRKDFVAHGIDLPKFDFAGGWKSYEIVVLFPVLAGTNRSRAKTAAAIRTDVLQ